MTTGDRSRKRLAKARLAHSGDILDQEVPARDQACHREADRLVVALYDPGDVLDEAIEQIGGIGRAVVKGVSIVHGITAQKRRALLSSTAATSEFDTGRREIIAAGRPSCARWLRTRPGRRLTATSPSTQADEGGRRERLTRRRRARNEITELETWWKGLGLGGSQGARQSATCRKLPMEGHHHGRHAVVGQRNRGSRRWRGCLVITVPRWSP